MSKKFTQTALLAGICIMLTLTGLGFIQTPLIRLTFVHLPVILAVLLVGKKEGIILGLIFGLCSLYSNITAPGITSPFFYNPLVSIFPRLMIPIMMIWVGSMMKNAKVTTKTFVTSMVGSLTNTVFVLGMMYILYAKEYALALNISEGGVLGALITIVLTNGVGEALLVSIVSLGVVKAMRKDIMI